MRKIVKLLIFLAIIAVGIAVYVFLVATRTAPGRQPDGAKSVIVTTAKAERTEQPVTVTAMGSVIPARSVTVFPEVVGRIVYKHPNLIPGGRVRAGQVLVRIDPRDYDLAVKQQRSQVSQAELQLARERGLKAVAEKEWAMIRDEVQPTEQGRKLALREIQLENAKAAVGSARSLLEKAELQRSRTVIRAPFNAIVTDEFVDVGQVASNAIRIAVLVDADAFWVRASVPVDRLSWIQIPGVNSDVGSQVQVVQQVGPALMVERTGQVLRLLGDLDPKGKMARLLVEVADPLGTGPNVRTISAHGIDLEPVRNTKASPLQEKPGPAPVQVGQPTERLAMPLLLGSFVTVRIQGPNLDNVIGLPRMALRDQNRVWVKNDQDALEVRNVAVVWARDDVVYISGNLHPGEEVITSRIAAPVDGMLVKMNGHRPVGGQEAKAKDQGASGDEQQPEPVDRAGERPEARATEQAP